MNYLKNLKWEMILFSLATIAIGVLMCIYPTKIVTAVCIVLASILFILGIEMSVGIQKKECYSGFLQI